MTVVDVWNSTGMPEDELIQPIEVSMALPVSVTLKLAVVSACPRLGVVIVHSHAAAQDTPSNNDESPRAQFLCLTLILRGLCTVSTRKKTLCRVRSRYILCCPRLHVSKASGKSEHSMANVYGRERVLAVAHPNIESFTAGSDP